MKKLIPTYRAYTHRRWKESDCDLSYAEYLREMKDVLPLHYNEHVFALIEIDGYYCDVRLLKHFKRYQIEYLWRKAGMFWTGRKLICEILEKHS